MDKFRFDMPADHFLHAQECLAQGNIQAAQVHATLATVDDLTAARARAKAITRYNERREGRQAEMDEAVSDAMEATS